jgi:hypothetical protein
VNEDDIQYKGREQREDGEYDVYEVDLGNEEEEGSDILTYPPILKER